MRVSWRTWMVIASVDRIRVRWRARKRRPSPHPNSFRRKNIARRKEGSASAIRLRGRCWARFLGGNGIVVAPTQTQSREDWDEVTVALVVPAPQADEAPVSIDQAIARAVSRVREGGQDLETVQRQQRRVDDKPAELMKVRYTDKNSGQQWVEELVFIEGPDSEIYSVGSEVRSLVAGAHGAAVFHGSSRAGPCRRQSRFCQMRSRGTPIPPKS